MAEIGLSLGKPTVEERWRKGGDGGGIMRDAETTCMVGLVGC